MESGVEADVVVPVPDSGVPAAIGYAQEAGLPFELGIIRNHYVGRTFIQPTDSIRHMGVKLKHNANRKMIEGKRVVLVDDSIVVVENIERYLRAGYSRIEAAIAATDQIAMAVIGCTATLLLAFLPLLNLPEAAGDFTRSLPMAVVTFPVPPKLTSKSPGAASPESGASRREATRRA